MGRSAVDCLVPEWRRGLDFATENRPNEMKMEMRYIHDTSMHSIFHTFSIASRVVHHSSICPDKTHCYAAAWSQSIVEELRLDFIRWCHIPGKLIVYSPCNLLQVSDSEATKSPWQGTTRTGGMSTLEFRRFNTSHRPRSGSLLWTSLVD
jgi:hypothetical protein